MHFQKQYDYDHFNVCCTVKISVTWTEGYKTCFMFNPTEHKILKNMIIFAFKLSDDVFTMLINGVIVMILSLMSMINYMLICGL